MRLLLCLTVFSLCGCNATLPVNEGDPTSISRVVTVIKNDVAKYQEFAVAVKGEEPKANTCRGKIDFDIQSIKVSLTTQIDYSVTGSAGATLPVGDLTFGPSASVARSTKGTQVLTFNLYPRISETKGAMGEIDGKIYPIAATLQKLRGELLEASDLSDNCLSLQATDPSKTENSTFTFGFAVTNSGSASGSLKFVIFSLGASGSVQKQAGNTITVAFKPSGSAELFRNPTTKTLE
jgi:hypothetical protein